MSHEVAGLEPLALDWAKRRWRKHWVECEPVATVLKWCLAIGAWVEERAIWQHVERARTGEPEALSLLVDEFRPNVLRLCTRMLGPIDAEDCANEAFQKAQLRLTSYDGTQPFGRWLLSIAAHQCIDRLRRRSVEKRIFDASEAEVEDLANNAVSALDLLVQSRLQSSVRDAVDRLPDRHRAPLVLRYFAEMDYDQIGEELGISRSQVASLLFRAKRQLRDHLRSQREAGS